MNSATRAISGTRRALKELADGTIRVQIDVDPRFKAQFHKLFPTIDMPVALAPLSSDFERREEEEKPKGGALARLAGMWCNDPKFCAWISWKYKGGVLPVEPAVAAQFVREQCCIDSRAKLDNDSAAADKFNNHIRFPYMKWLEKTVNNELNV